MIITKCDVCLREIQDKPVPESIRPSWWQSYGLHDVCTGCCYEIVQAILRAVDQTKVARRKAGA